MGHAQVRRPRSPRRAEAVTSARWYDVRDEIRTGIGHLDKACRLFDEFSFTGDDLDAYVNRMALMHAMQSGYTSIETGLDRVLQLLGEERPQGADWHKALLRRMASPLGDERPAVLSAEVYKQLDELRRFRHVASRTYDTFDLGQAAPAVEAARNIVANLLTEVDAFQMQVDPPG